jgi:hypothetical protein
MILKQKDIAFSFLLKEIKKEFAQAFFYAEEGQWIILIFENYDPLTYRFSLDFRCGDEQIALSNKVLACFQKLEGDDEYTLDECAGIANTHNIHDYINTEHLHHFIDALCYKLDVDEIEAQLRSVSINGGEKTSFPIDQFIHHVLRPAKSGVSEEVIRLGIAKTISKLPYLRRKNKTYLQFLDLLVRMVDQKTFIKHCEAIAAYHLKLFRS